MVSLSVHLLHALVFQGLRPIFYVRGPLFVSIVVTNWYPASPSASAMPSQQMVPRYPSLEPSLNTLALVRHAISRFNSEDQDTLFRGFATLLSLAIDLVNNRTDTSVAVRLGDTMPSLSYVFILVVPMTWSFLLLFVLWKQNSIWRPLRRSSSSVIIVDMLGEVLILEDDTFSSWEVSTSVDMGFGTRTYCMSADYPRLPAARLSGAPWCCICATAGLRTW